MKKDKTFYTQDSIESLSPLEFTRLRPGVYCGDTTYSTQLLVEIVSNAIDEYRLGHGNKIDVYIRDDVIQVRDYGQGFIPNSYREDGKTILEAAFSVLNTSGKYREDGTYDGTSLGSLGIGSKITVFLSNWCHIATCRDNQVEHIHFVEGIFQSRDNSAEGFFNEEKHGTVVRWKPSGEFFTNTTIETKRIEELFRTTVSLCPGLTINFDNNGTKTVYYSKNGLVDLVDEKVGQKEIIDNRLEVHREKGKNAIDLIMTYTTDYTSTVVPYVNTGLTEKGPHITQIKTTFTREFNKFFKEKGWLKEKDENLSGDDIQEGMYIIFNLTSSGVAYNAQVKSTVTKIDMSFFVSQLAEDIQLWLKWNEKDIKAIADKAINARKAREAARRAKENIRNKEKKKEKVLKFDSKLADCYSKDRKKCELYVTEGDSASGNLKAVRNNEFVAILPVRGKILNVRKATLDKVQKNAEIMTLIDAIGLTVDKKTMKLTYEPEDLRYGKIIIMSDADVNLAYEKLYV